MRCPLCSGPTPQEQVQVCAEHGAMLDELAADIVTNRIRTTTLAELDARAERREEVE